MIITRTPLRISIGGGGTDLPSFYEQRGGYVISAAVSKHIYIGLNRTFTDDYLLKYSELERTDRREDIKHRIVRAVFERHDVQPGIELVSVADIPAGTGLGSSGSFTVGLLRAVYALKRHHASAQEIADEACDIEINVLGEPVGKQDQFIASYGGLTCFEFHQDGTTTATPLSIPERALHELEEHLLLFFTGYSRSASEILKDQKDKSTSGDTAMLDNLEHTKSLGMQIKTALEGGDPRGFGELMHEHWLHKRSRSQGMSNRRIDELYELGRANGAVGGKLVGAGAGGFLMFYADEPRRVRDAMFANGLTETRFAFDLDGATVTVRD